MDKRPLDHQEGEPRSLREPGEGELREAGKSLFPAGEAGRIKGPARDKFPVFGHDFGGLKEGG